MKKILLFIPIIIFFFTGCKKDDAFTYVEKIPSGGKVAEIIVSPSFKTLYVDSDFPRLSYLCVPANAADTTAVWSSSNPDVLGVDAKTGALSWGNTIQNTQVTITATSADGTNKQGTCVFEIRNMLGVYTHIDLTKELGIWMLDRNIGATTRGVPLVFNYRMPGNFYHYRCNTVVANYEFGGPDGRGGERYYRDNNNSYKILGGNPEFNMKWEGEDLGVLKASDWTTAENSPCPKGWRLPTKQELDSIVYKTNPDNYKTPQAKGAAILLRKKLYLSFSGYLELPGGTWEMTDSFWWSSDWNPVTKEAYCLRVTNGAYYEGPMEVVLKKITGIAMPIRCVKSK